MLDSDSVARDFLAHLEDAEKTDLLNTLLALNHVHHKNTDASFFSYRSFKKLFDRETSECVQSYRFINSHNNELLINQLKDRSFLKSRYRIEIFYDLEECGYQLIEALLTELKNSLLVQSYA